MKNPIIIIVFAALVFITVADVGAAAQAAYPDYPIWMFVLLADLCLVVFVYRSLKR